MVKTMLEGVRQTIRVCTKCLRKIKEARKVLPVRSEIQKVAPVEQITQTIEPAFVKVIDPEAQTRRATAGKEVKVKTTTIAELMKESDAKVLTEKKEAKKPVVKAKAKTKKQEKKK